MTHSTSTPYSTFCLFQASILRPLFFFFFFFNDTAPPEISPLPPPPPLPIYPRFCPGGPTRATNEVRVNSVLRSPREFAAPRPPKNPDEDADKMEIWLTSRHTKL